MKRLEKDIINSNFFVPSLSLSKLSNKEERNHELIYEL